MRSFVCYAAIHAVICNAVHTHSILSIYRKGIVWCKHNTHFKMHKNKIFSWATQKKHEATKEKSKSTLHEPWYNKNICVKCNNDNNNNKKRWIWNRNAKINRNNKNKATNKSKKHKQNIRKKKKKYRERQSGCFCQDISLLCFTFVFPHNVNCDSVGWKCTVFRNSDNLTIFAVHSLDFCVGFSDFIFENQKKRTKSGKTAKKKFNGLSYY